jgi:hypothetical protein
MKNVQFARESLSMEAKELQEKRKNRRTNRDVLLGDFLEK